MLRAPDKGDRIILSGAVPCAEVTHLLGRREHTGLKKLPAGFSGVVTHVDEEHLYLEVVADSIEMLPEEVRRINDEECLNICVGAPVPSKELRRITLFGNRDDEMPWRAFDVPVSRPVSVSQILNAATLHGLQSSIPDTIPEEIFKAVAFDFEGTDITDPTHDETGRVEVNPFEYYDVEDVYLWYAAALRQPLASPCKDCGCYVPEGENCGSDNEWLCPDCFTHRVRLSHPRRDLAGYASRPSGGAGGKKPKVVLLPMEELALHFDTCNTCGDWIEIHGGLPVCKSGCAQTKGSNQ
jgi:hypothetical protein